MPKGRCRKTKRRRGQAGRVYKKRVRADQEIEGERNAINGLTAYWISYWKALSKGRPFKKGTKGGKVGNASVFLLSILTAVLLLAFLLCFSYAEGVHDNERLADAIFKAEGGYKATYLYGIRSINYDDEQEARRICLNTIRNNKVRYKEYGYKTHKTYLEFLASRYCPIGAKNDPKNLNQHWLKNVRYFYAKK